VKLFTVVSHLEIKGTEAPKTLRMSCGVHLFLIYLCSWRVFLNSSELQRWSYFKYSKIKRLSNNI